MILILVIFITMMKRPAKFKNSMVLAKMLKISEVQRIQLRLIEIASFNGMDGVTIVHDLLDNIDLWDCCLMDREAYGDSQDLAGLINLIKLRDMSEDNFKRVGDTWNVDTLFIMPKKGKEKQLEKMAGSGRWGGSLSWIDKLESGQALGGYPSQRQVRLLKIYWD